MKKNNYAVYKQKFLCSYKSFIDYIDLIHKDQNMYNILVLRKDSKNNLVTVSVIIRNCNNDEKMLNEFSNNVLLSREEANDLVYDIREDFRNNYDIQYSTINPKNFIQTLQNTIFSLHIKLNNISEFEEALKFNSKINCNKVKSKVLSSN